MSQDSALLSPVALGDLHLPNRVIMAPLTRCRATVPGNVPNEMMRTYYRQRAGAGLIISEATQVVPEGQGYPATPGIHSDEQQAGWEMITRAVHDAGGRMILQLWHVGRVSHSDFQPGGQLPVAPSPIAIDGEGYVPSGEKKPFETPRALETEEIPALVEAYAQATSRALAAGFDGVEVHAANGYLIDQFLRDGTNERSDRYGGSLENRMRLLREVLAAVTRVAGASRTGVRISPLQPMNGMYDSAPWETFSYVVRELNAFGLAYLHIAGMGEDAPGAAGPAFDLAELVPLFHGPVIRNYHYDQPRAEADVSEGRAAAVAFGVPFIANPDLVDRMRRDAPWNEPDAATFYGGGEEGYIDYPTLADLA
ncbi:MULTISPECIES: alkene reductase [unclassified Guyparkeria]|uniref:alkene reductase n=1 Tax=unclassified Guyparkeria TaxID=2626246 RepID=UPI000733926A|nr:MULTISPECIES: alkene reductase [unclassified Guyparkeria]KTG17597.1 alkene reductase [Guyparkeria sp. XI15]OAE88410.1 alkene reductase [Guyparkeria sp. WRN-7]